ncbi:MAG: DUF3419 family protein [Candidatus Cloacimonadota bacterium]|nr:MAG: DUF3419 family protein [Candidatus Cloacimonadota bacterium]
MNVIRYSNCWEDTDVLLKAMNVKRGGTYLSISSAGDNTLSILSQNPSFVLAVDNNPAQIACLELRKAAFANLTYEKVLEFLGINDAQDRISTYKIVRDLLSRESRNFWDKNYNFISKGIIHAGKIEGYYRLFRKWILPFILNRRKMHELLKKKNKTERIDFYNKEVNSWCWKIFFKIFFSRAVMTYLDLGRKPEFYRTVKRDIAQYVMQRTEYALTALPLHNNPYLEYIIRGNFKKTLPFYLLRENFEIIHNNLNKLKIFRGSLIEAIKSNRTLEFDGFNLSDIFEYMSNDQYVTILKMIINSAEKGARLVYWNNLKKRESPLFLREHLKSLDKISRNLFLQNRAFFYSSLIIEEVQ